LGGRQPGGEGFARRWRVDGDVSAEPPGGEDALRGRLVDVGEAEALWYGEVGGLAGLAADLDEYRMRAPDECRHTRGRGHLRDGDADGVRVGRGIALDEAVVFEGGDQPPRRRAVQPAFVGQLGEGARGRRAA